MVRLGKENWERARSAILGSCPALAVSLNSCRSKHDLLFSLSSPSSLSRVLLARSGYRPPCFRSAALALKHELVTVPQGRQPDRCDIAWLALIEA
eukprot:1145510-Pelagomonas_calceolata.AAC.9